MSSFGSLFIIDSSTSSFLFKLSFHRSISLIAVSVRFMYSTSCCFCVVCRSVYTFYKWTWKGLQLFIVGGRTMIYICFYTESRQAAQPFSRLSRLLRSSLPRPQPIRIGKGEYPGGYRPDVSCAENSTRWTQTGGARDKSNQAKYECKREWKCACEW